MFQLSFTDYVDVDVDTVRVRVADEAASAPTSSSVEVTPMSGHVSRVVVRMPWDGRDDVSRRDSTLTATRFASRVLEAAGAS